MHALERVEAAVKAVADELKLKAVELGGLLPRIAIAGLDQSRGDCVHGVLEIRHLLPEQRRSLPDRPLEPPRQLLVQGADERLARHSGSPAVMRS